MINYDEELGVKVELTKNGSILMVNKTKPSHGGNYTCSPSNAKSAYVMVHVIEGEQIKFTKRKADPYSVCLEKSFSEK